MAELAILADPAAATEAGSYRWPLTGRGAEVAKLVHATRSSSALLVGPAGVGKTRLLEELECRLSAAGRRAWRLTATHTSAAIPLGTVAPLLDGGARTVQQTLAGARRIAARLAEDVVVVDDAHLLDPASATLLHHLTMLGVTVVAAVRSEVRAPDAVVAAARDSHAVRVDVQPLALQEVRDLLHRVLGADVDEATLRKLHEVSVGNLIYLRELVNGALESGALCRERDVWRLDSPPGTNPGLTQLVEGRLGRLPPGQREVLELVAVAEPMSLDSARELVGEDGLARLEEAGLVTLVRDGRRHEIRLSHPVYAGVIREGMSAIRRVALHRIAAEQLERTPMRRRDDVVRVSVHRLEGGGSIDAGVVTAAAERAVLAGDPTLGARLARAAIVAGEEAAGGLLLAEAMSAMGRDLDAIDALTKAWESARSDEHIALAAMRRALVAFWVQGDAAAAAEMLDAGSARISERRYLDELEAQRATFSLLSGDFDTAVRQAQPILDSGGGRAAIVAAIAAAPALAVQGHAEQALRVAAEAHHDVVELGPELVMSAPAVHTVGRVLALQEMGRLGPALGEARQAYDEAVEAGDVESQGWLALMLGRTELATGHLAAAGRWFDEGVAVFSSMGVRAQERWCLAGRVLVDAWKSDPVVSTSLGRLLACEPGPTTMMEADVLRAIGWAAGVMEDLPAALKLVAEATDLARQQGAAALEAACLHDIVRLGGPPPVERLEELAVVVDGELTVMRARHASAVADSDAAGLLAVSDSFEQMGAVLLAAEAAAQAAAALVASGQRRRSRRASQRSDRLTEMTDGAHTPLLELRGQSAELTSRELEVSRLAARGSTNAAIAHQLGISSRTVENHLQRSYEKLGVHSREDLADVLRSPEMAT